MNYHYCRLLQSKFKCQRCGKCCSFNPDCNKMDRLTNDCTVYKDRPELCRDYPFMAYFKHKTTWDAVMICPGALDALKRLLE